MLPYIVGVRAAIKTRSEGVGMGLPRQSSAGSFALPDAG